MSRVVTNDVKQVGSMRFAGQHGAPMQGIGSGMDGMMYSGMMAQAQAAQQQMHDQEMGSLNQRGRHDQDMSSSIGQNFHGQMTSHAMGLSSGIKDSQAGQMSSVGGMVGGGGGLLMKQMGAQMGSGSLSDGHGMSGGGGLPGVSGGGAGAPSGMAPSVGSMEGVSSAGASYCASVQTPESMSSVGVDSMMGYGDIRDMRVGSTDSLASGGNMSSAASFGDEHHKVNRHRHHMHVDASMSDVEAGTNNPGVMPNLGNAPRMLGAGRQGRHRPGNPVVKLSVKLLDTYKIINDKYYTRQKSKAATKQQTQNRRIYNDGYDDEAGDYIVREGDIIRDRYKITVRPGSKTPLLGRGSFGQVAYAHDMTENLGVAIKIIKNQKHFHEQAKTEIELLKRFLLVPRLHRIPVPPSDYNRDSYLPCTEFVEQANTVRLLDTFVHKCHQCLVFEILPLSLYDLLKFSKFKGFSLSLVRKLTRNILFNLASLRQANVDVIHCDLKPENVMLIKHNEYRLKVIDFGSSCSSSNKPFYYIQSRFYRSPEVLLCRYAHSPTLPLLLLFIPRRALWRWAFRR
jgi:hypothetical protein